MYELMRKELEHLTKEMCKWMEKYFEAEARAENAELRLKHAREDVALLAKQLEKAEKRKR